MKGQNSKQISLLLAIILFFLVISVIFIELSDDKRTRRVLFFPQGTLRELTGEIRYLPQRKDREEAVSLVVKELILGPVEYQNIPMLPQGTKLRSSIVRGETVYLDFDRRFVWNREDDASGLQRSLDGISKTVLYNTPSIKEVVITVNGEALFDDFHIGNR